MFDRAVEVADPMRSLAAHLPPRPAGRVVVIGAGKASARMAEAVEAVWGPCEGLVITRYGYGRPLQGIELVEAAHPVPDAAGAAATLRMIALLQGLGPQDFVLALIGSGPTVGDQSTAAEALDLLARWGVAVPPSVTAALQRGSGVLRPDDPRLATVENRIIAAPSQSLAAAKALAEAAGCQVHLLGDALEGEARDVAAQQAAGARAIAATLARGAAPVVLLSGGELTVTRRGKGVGGPNAEFCLALAIHLMGYERIHALACDTDGVDGAAEVAGAIVTPDTLARSPRDAAGALAQNDAHSFFAALGDQVITGPTLTNVNDFRAILIEAPQG